GAPNPGQYKHLRPGSPCFLFNYTTQSFEGLFKATTSITKDLDAGAWKGKYPHQVRFELFSVAPVSVKKQVAVSVFGNPRMLHVPEEKQRQLVTLMQTDYGLRIKDE
ncbi:hypothetical protein TeGR_g8968, partial [Tetraparma gracilis]